MIYKILLLVGVLLLIGTGCQPSQEIFKDDVYFYRDTQTELVHRSPASYKPKYVVIIQRTSRREPVAYPLHLFDVGRVRQYDTGTRAFYYPSQLTPIESNFFGRTRRSNHSFYRYQEGGSSRGKKD